MVPIELEKVKKKAVTTEQELKPWIAFLENPKEVVQMSKANTVAIEKAKEVLKEISEDEHERYLAFLRQKYIMDQKATEQAGYHKGLKVRNTTTECKSGKKERYARTECNNGIQKVAKQMLSKGIDIKTISNVTGISEEDLAKLK